MAPLTDRLRADLLDAMRRRDQVRVNVLRTALAAIANAEAPPVSDLPDPSPVPVVGRRYEHPRRRLSETDIERIIREEIADRQDTVEQFRRAGRDDAASTLRVEISILGRYLA